MKKLIAFIFLLTTINGISQNRNWNTKTSKDGKTVVKYDIVKNNGKTHIYYTAETKGDVSIEKIENYFSVSENHKQFLENTTKSEQVKKTSDTEWTTYYYFDAPWPMPNSDAVLNFKTTKTNTTIAFTGTSAPKSYKTTDVKRMETYNIKYSFEKINNNSTKVIISADFVPIGSVPKWLLKGWFPKGPAGIASRLLKEASKQ
ncbi:hypothetical protein [Tenacibaculum aiptasiae]|uniref:hypothetical protein n=1 Tax=Tenacibaculum aiptasiae TaxID=426481 RepID=UPI0023302FB6|nr:hypothetical protein [Tenacibaculum aiptasiae]